jgi:regulator of sigma E protease
MQSARQSAQLGGVYYLFFIALFSVSIGVLNLLPIPLLDGGHLLFELIEIILGRRLSKEWKLRGLLLGMVLVLLLTMIALYNDLA